MAAYIHLNNVFKGIVTAAHIILLQVITWLIAKEIPFFYDTKRFNRYLLQQLFLANLGYT